MKMELSAENLRKLKLDENIMNAYNSNKFELVYGYKYKRDDIIDIIKSNSNKVNLNSDEDLILKPGVNLQYFLTQTHWLIVKKDTFIDNIAREQHYFIPRELFIPFFVFTKDFEILFKSKTDSPISKTLYDDIKDINKLLLNYRECPLDMFIPGDVKLRDHIIWIINAFNQKNDDYNLLSEFLTK